MRMTASIATAAALHGIVLGVGAAVLSRQPVRPPVPPVAPVAVELVAARPDPVVERPEPPPVPRANGARAPRARARNHDVTPTTAAPESAREAAPEAAPATGEPVLAASSGRRAAAKIMASPAAAPAATGSAVVSAVPRYRRNPKPDYPIPCRRRGEEGTVLLSVTVSPGGEPTAVSLHHTSGHPLLDRAAMDAVRRWTFEPGRSGGAPTASQVIVPLTFSLSDLP